MATLRDPWLATSTVTPEDLASLEASGMGSLRRGYESTRLGTEANYNLAQEASLRAANKNAEADALRTQTQALQQRASICRALIHEPKMLLLDEPFGALDAFTREELWCMLRDLWQEKPFTVILVTHDLREAVFLADTVYVMSARPGRVLLRQPIDLPRPRDLDLTYTDAFAQHVHALREHIGQQRH